MRYHRETGRAGGGPPRRRRPILRRPRRDVESLSDGRKTIEYLISPAFAHGASPGGAVGGAGPLVLVAGAILFALFLVFVNRRKGWSVLVTGGAGYVGSVLVPMLLARGHKVTVLDLYLFGEEALQAVREHVNLREIKGDIRDPDTIAAALRGCDAVIHLAAVSDPRSYDLDPALGRSVNLDAVGPLVAAAKGAGVKRFLLTSSAAVYGAGATSAAEEESPGPVGGFAADKARSEEILLDARAPGFVPCVLRPAEICGPAPCQRLDTTVNAMTHAAVEGRPIAVPGDGVACPGISVDDMAALLLFVLGQPDGRIDGKVFNAVAWNGTLGEAARTVRQAVGGDIAPDAIDGEAADGGPTRLLSPEGMRGDLGFEPSHTLAGAVADLAGRLHAGGGADTPGRPRYGGVDLTAAAK